ncbi:MAG: caspase family protein [Candidatus Atribacteria bacterium]|nr:caspase family protein [Candidatus Atribacteria bacterium]
MYNRILLSKKFLILLIILISSSLLNSGCGGTTSPPITTNETVYRAYCVGVGNYINFPDSHGNTDLPGPPYDVDRMRQTLGYCKFGLSNTGFSTISYLKDRQATKSNILQGIASTFSAADNNDISYFYFSGHGMRPENTSYLCPAEASYYAPMTNYISVDELENALSAIPGTKVVFLDTCHSGGFIGKGKGEITISQEELESFNNEIINVFSQAQSKGLLTTNQYKVLTACHYYQESMGLSPTTPGDFEPFGVFTMALCSGCGYFDYNYFADTNLDTKVSLQEAYLYVKSYVAELDAQIPYIDITQDVQVYPSNSTFTIVEY